MWKILVVDDHPGNRELIKEMLKDYAYCDVAADGDEAIDKYNLSLSDKRYDLILLDIAMPGIDGLEFLKQLREKEEKFGIYVGKGTPVIMVTSYKEFCYDAFNHGCDDYVLKPMVPDELIGKIKKSLLGKRK
ncbi:response regulator [bacterium]|nr:response regulator [bacterium]